MPIEGTSEGRIVAYTGEETLALRVLELERERFHDAYNVLRDRFCDDAEVRTQINEMEAALNAATVEVYHVLHARLVRVLPHLADVISFLCFHEFYGPPEWVDVLGRPDPWIEPRRRRPGAVRAEEAE